MIASGEAVAKVQEALGCKPSISDRCLKHWPVSNEQWAGRGCPVSVAAADAAAAPIAAQALREAAEDVQRGGEDERRGATGRAAFIMLARWIRDRADRIEQP